MGRFSIRGFNESDIVDHFGHDHGPFVLSGKTVPLTRRDMCRVPRVATWRHQLCGLLPVQRTAQVSTA